MKCFLYLALLSGFAACTPIISRAQEAITNDTIISLIQAQLGETLVISKIRTSSCNLDVSTNALLNLKKAGDTRAAAYGTPAVQQEPAPSPC